MKKIANAFLSAVFMGNCLLAAGCGGGGGSDAIATKSTNSGNQQAVNKVPAAPSNVTATSGINKVILSWDPVAGADSYNIYWSTDPGVTEATGTKITCAAHEYQHVGLASRGYFYVVTAVNSFGESAASSQAYTIAANDSANLYATYCASCHGAITATTIMSGTPDKITAAIANNTGEMAVLSFLTPEQISIISQQLPCH